MTEKLGSSSGGVCAADGELAGLGEWSGLWEMRCAGAAAALVARVANGVGGDRAGCGHGPGSVRLLCASLGAAALGAGGGFEGQAEQSRVSDRESKTNVWVRSSLGHDDRSFCS